MRTAAEPPPARRGGTVGVDPGATHTGVVVLQGDHVAWGTTVETARTVGGALDVDYAEAIRAAVAKAFSATRQLPDACGVEDVVQMHRVNPHDLTRTAGAAYVAVVQALEWSVPVYAVRPAQHGSADCRVYPLVLHDPHCSRGGYRGADAMRACSPKAGKRRHVRSAYDVALAARTLHRQRA